MKNRFLLILLSLSFSGCSLLYSYDDNLPQRLDQWASEKKYNIALNTIDHIKPAHKDYLVIQEKKKRITKQMNNYEKMAIKESTLLASKGNWLKALKLLKEVADNIVDAKDIEKHHNNLINKRHIVIHDYENDVLYRQAEDLAEKMDLYGKIKKTVSEDENNQLYITQFHTSRKEISLRLTTLGEQQYKDKQYNNALKTINLALKLKPEDKTTHRLEKTKKHIKHINETKKISHLKKAKILLSKLTQGYSHAILNRTKSTIVWLNKNKEDNKPYQTLINKLKKHLAKGVKQRFEAARKLYSKGKTQEALSIWLELKELDPYNAKLLSHIERAEKVLSKFKKLSNKPAKNK